MRNSKRGSEALGYPTLDEAETRVLSAAEERDLLLALDECRRRLSGSPAGPDGPATILKQYRELRGRLALANVRLVAHVAMRYRDHGVSDADLIQEGFCGLLEAIDRFDVSRGTKLGTYATWWIRQSMQQAVASGAYPVRLSPRHLRQLAQNQDVLMRGPDHTGAGSVSSRNSAAPSYELIHRIQTATRPAISIDAGSEGEERFSLLQTLSDREGDHTDDVALNETVTRLFQALRPREQEVVALRFGLVGRPRKSLSQVGKLLNVSKERIRQIQKNALLKLRAAAEADAVGDLFPAGA